MLFDNPPEQWSITTLGEVCSQGGGGIQTGPFGSQLHASDYVDEGIPSIMPANIGDNRISEDGIARITNEDAGRLSKYLVKCGDIVYSRRGDVEKCALIRTHEDGWLCGTGCLRVRPGNGVVDPSYCAYFLSHPESREWISRHAVGATMPNLNTQILSEVPFLLPALNEQKAIAHILGAFDDKIELNRKTSETLEGIAKALFRSWFVDFDPVRAKAEGRPTGLPEEISEFFPDSFEESELGQIPSGWVVESADKHLELIKGRSYKSAELQESKTALVTLKSFQRGGGYREDGLKPYIGTFKENQVIQPGELIIALTDVTQAADVIGRPAIVRTSEVRETLVASLDVGIIREIKHGLLPQAFVYELFRTDNFVSHALSYTSGTTVLHLAKGVLADFQVVIPPMKLIKTFTSLSASVLERIDVSSQESRSLQKLRDVLLPRLISGELRVPDAEKMLEEVGI